MTNETFTNIFDAITKGTLEDVRYFVEQQDTDVNAKDYIGRTPLYFAVWCKSSDIELWQFLLSHGADVNANYKGTTSIHLVAKRGSLETLQFFVSHGADIHAKDHIGRTPLSLVVTHRNLPATQYLVSQGADINAKNVTGRTPLHEATQYISSFEILKYLVSQGADVGVEDNEGKTALDYILEREAEYAIEAASGNEFERLAKWLREAKELLRQAAG